MTEAVKRKREELYGASFPVFTWEEEIYYRPHQTKAGLPDRTSSSWRDAPWRQSSRDSPRDNPKPQSSFSHSATRIEGQEGLLVDTGAVKNLTGKDFVHRQDRLAREYGERVHWSKLENPQGVSGVGGEAQMCIHQATVPGVLEI